MDQSYNHSAVLKIFPEIKARTLISWSERGLLTPLQAASGRGSSRLYSYSNLMEISIISELLQYGIPFAQIHTIMQSKVMRNLLEAQRWETVFLIARGRKGGVNSPVSTIAYGVMDVEQFLDTGGMWIADIAPEASTDKIQTSTIAINIYCHEHFVKMKTKDR